MGKVRQKRSTQKSAQESGLLVPVFVLDTTPVGSSSVHERFTWCGAISGLAEQHSSESHILGANQCERGSTEWQFLSQQQ